MTDPIIPPTTETTKKPDNGSPEIETVDLETDISI